MRISEIEVAISSNQDQIRTLQKQVAELSKVNNQLSQLREIKLTELFFEYIQLGSTHTFNSYAYLNGIQTGIKKDDKSYNSNFGDGDVIEFIKKNKKSIVVKCTTKILTEAKPGGVRIKKVTHPNWVFRIDIDSIYNYMIKNQQFKQSFTAYIKRKESLDLLGI